MFVHIIIVDWQYTVVVVVHKFCKDNLNSTSTRILTQVTVNSAQQKWAKITYLQTSQRYASSHTEQQLSAYPTKNRLVQYQIKHQSVTHSQANIVVTVPVIIHELLHFQYTVFRCRCTLWTEKNRKMFVCPFWALGATDRRPRWRCASAQSWRRWGTALKTILFSFASILK